MHKNGLTYWLDSFSCWKLQYLYNIFLFAHCKARFNGILRSGEEIQETSLIASLLMYVTEFTFFSA